RPPPSGLAHPGIVFAVRLQLLAVGGDGEGSVHGLAADGYVHPDVQVGALGGDEVHHHRARVRPHHGPQQPALVDELGEVVAIGHTSDLDDAAVDAALAGEDLPARVVDA